MRVRFWLLVVLLAGASLWSAEPPPAETPQDSSLNRVQDWLKQYENSREGELPDTFCVRISLDGYLNRKTKEGTFFFRPREVYEFTPREVRRLCLRAEGVDENGNLKYREDKEEVAARKPFSKIDDVCRILLALEYTELVRRDERATKKNLNYLQVLTDTGLKAAGGSRIQVGAAGTEVSCFETCLFRTSPTSAHSIRYGALYHTLRRLARSELGLSGDDWRDALDIIDVDGSVKPAKGEFRASK